MIKHNNKFLARKSIENKLLVNSQTKLNKRNLMILNYLESLSFIMYLLWF